MKNKKSRYNGSSIFVNIYGIFVFVCLLIQCLIPLFQNIFLKNDKELSIINSIFNGNLDLPIDLIASFWVAISTAYIGVEKGSMVIGKFNGIEKLPNVSSKKHLKQIIIISFILVIESLLLGFFFDRSLALSALCSAFGSSILLYVAGNKVETSAESLRKGKDLNNDGICDSEQTFSKIKEELIKKDNKEKGFTDIDNNGVDDKLQTDAEIEANMYN